LSRRDRRLFNIARNPRKERKSPRAYEFQIKEVHHRPATTPKKTTERERENEGGGRAGEGLAREFLKRKREKVCPQRESCFQRTQVLRRKEMVGGSWGRWRESEGES